MHPHALVRSGFLRRGLGVRSALAGLGFFLVLALGGPAAAVVCWEQGYCPDDDPNCSCGPPPPTPALEIWLDPLSGTSFDYRTYVSQTDWGLDVDTILEWSSDPHSRTWHFNLAAGQSLEPLSDGSVAVVTSGDEPTGDWGETYDDEPTELEAQAPEDTSVEDPAIAEDENYDDAGNYDPPAPDTPSDPPAEDSDPEPTQADLDAMAETERVLGHIARAQELSDTQVDVVLPSPQAQTVLGNPLAAWYSVSGDTVSLNVQSAGGGSYPIRVASDLIEEPAETPEETDQPPSSVESSSATEVPADCPFAQRAQFVSYNPTGWLQLFNALRAHRSDCVEYFVVVPGKAGDKTQLRKCRDAGPTPLECEARERRTQADGRPAWIVDYVREAGPNFHPVAEYHWHDWARWADPKNVCPGPGATWTCRAVTFRKRMRAVGYGSRSVVDQRIIRETWAINELPSSFRRSADFRMQKAIPVIMGLYRGLPAWRSTQPGIPFVVNFGHETPNLNLAYRPRLRTVLRHARFWRALGRRVMFWSQETYTNCYKVCLGRHGLDWRASRVNAFTQHVKRFAQAGAAAGEARAAWSVLGAKYLPLMTAYWDNSTYGHTERPSLPPPPPPPLPGISLEQMKGFVSLQVYSSARHSLGRGERRPRLGLAWDDGTSDFEALADHTARALVAAFGSNGTPVAACNVTGRTDGYWCRLSVPYGDGTTHHNRCEGPPDQRDCNPWAHKTVENRAWFDFSRWP